MEPSVRFCRSGSSSARRREMVTHNAFWRSLSVDGRQSSSMIRSDATTSSAWINSSKQDACEILDPYDVENGWFEILLPSLQLVVTDQIPDEYREAAQFTLERLHPRDDERVLRQRRSWMRLFEEGKLTLDGLREMARCWPVASSQRIVDQSSREVVRALLVDS